MQSITDESGQLVEVESFYYTDLPTDIGLIKLAFQQNSFFVVVKEDDSLELTDKVTFTENDFKRINMSDKLPWQAAIGKQIRWIWTMVNQQGYLDGLQFEFANNINQKPVVIQLIAVASGIKVYNRVSLTQKLVNLSTVKKTNDEEILMNIAA